MNTQQMNVEELEVHTSQLKEVVHSLLQTIMFVRSFGSVKPSEVHVEFLDLYYIKCDDKSVDLKIEEKAEEFCTSFAKRKTNKGQIVLSFYEKKQKNNFFFQIGCGVLGAVDYKYTAHEFNFQNH